MSDRNMVQLILDTDMETDCDDVAALAILNHYMRQRKVKILGVICDAPTEWGGGCIEEINKYFSHPDLPVGVIRGLETTDETERYRDYNRHVQGLSPSSCYNAVLAKGNGKRADEYPPAVELYRKLLAKSEDHSVTICCIGLLTALEQLLKSEPDLYSPLTGCQLVQSKVLSIVSMASMTFPVGVEAFNWRMDPFAAEYVVNHCPVPISVSSFGQEVLTGASLSLKLPIEHPVRKAYEVFLGGAGRGRPSWDQIALLYAIGKDTGLFEEITGYTVQYCAQDHTCTWARSNGGRGDRYIRLRGSNAAIAEYIESLMCQ